MVLQPMYAPLVMMSLRIYSHSKLQLRMLACISTSRTIYLLPSIIGIISTSSFICFAYLRWSVSLSLSPHKALLLKQLDKLKLFTLLCFQNFTCFAACSCFKLREMESEFYLKKGFCFAWMKQGDEIESYSQLPALHANAERRRFGPFLVQTI